MLLLLTILSAFLYASIVEYCLHRFVQHRSYEIDHIINHHRIFHGIKSYTPENAKSEDILMGFRGLLLNGFLYLLSSIIIFMQNEFLGIIFFIGCYLYNLWEELVHLYSHKNTNIFIGKLSVFKRLKEHHRVHHYIYNSNYGIGTTLWDIVFGTKRIADKEHETRVVKMD